LLVFLQISKSPKDPITNELTNNVWTTESHPIPMILIHSKAPIFSSKGNYNSCNLPKIW
jgi:hypothetical protein